MILADYQNSMITGAEAKESTQVEKNNFPDRIAISF